MLSEMTEEAMSDMLGDAFDQEDEEEVDDIVNKTLAEIAKLGTVHWYGNNFLVYALKEVEDPDKPSKFTEALFLRKVSY